MKEADIFGGACPTQYVAGFMFDSTLTRVALIRKEKPAWQAGKLNGVGGKVEPGETFLGAMVREFREETGADTSEAQWRRVHHMAGRNDDGGRFEVDFFACIGDLGSLRTMTAERVEILNASALFIGRKDTVENLVWLVGIAYDHLTDGRPHATGSAY